jgi:nucleolar MIF4G domain-containing protein 1
MARRILNRKDLRADYEAAERRKQEDEEEVEDEEEETDESDDEVEAEDEGEEVEDEEEEEAPKKKKKAPVKEAKPKRSRAAKQVRMKVVWGVFNNSNQCVAKFDYPKRREAEEHANKLASAKTPPQPFFIQPVKEPMEDKKD